MNSEKNPANRWSTPTPAIRENVYNLPTASLRRFPLIIGIKSESDQFLAHKVASWFSRLRNWRRLRQHPWIPPFLCHIEIFIPPPHPVTAAMRADTTPGGRRQVQELEQEYQRRLKRLEYYTAVSVSHQYGTYATNRYVPEEKYIFFQFDVTLEMFTQMLIFLKNTSQQGFSAVNQTLSIIPCNTRCTSSGEYRPDGWTCTKYLQAMLRSAGLMLKSQDNPDLVTFLIDLYDSLAETMGQSFQPPTLMQDYMSDNLVKLAQIFKPVLCQPHQQLSLSINDYPLPA